jgi:hypothetical protein
VPAQQTVVRNPSFTCDAMTVTKASDTMWRFNMQSRVSDTQAEGYRFTFSDQGQATTSNPWIDKPVTTGPIKVYGQVLTNEGESPVSDACSVTAGGERPVAAAADPVTVVAPAPANAAPVGPAVLHCDKVTVSDVSPTMWRFSVHARAENTTISGYRFSFSDSGAQATTDAGHPYTDKVKTSSPLKVRAQVLGNDGSVTPQTEQCSVTAGGTGASPAPTRSASPAPTYSVTPTPSGQVLGAATPALPDTGPEVALGGAVGLGIVGYAGRAYLRSRKALRDSLKRR